jgi:hypothetical protein
VLTTYVEARPTQRPRTGLAATLIAAGRPGAQIAALLRRQGLKTARFATPEELPAKDARTDPSLVVMWAGALLAGPHHRAAHAALRGRPAARRLR